MSIDISNLKSALDTLKSSIKTLNANRTCNFADMLEDSCIKRFEYTLEIARKLMKKVLKKVYGITEEELTVNNTFRFMQGYNFITNWENKLIDLIPQFIEDTDFLIEKLEEKLPKND